MALRVRYAKLTFHTNNFESQKINTHAININCTECVTGFSLDTNTTVFVFFFKNTKVIERLYKIIPFKSMWDFKLNKKIYDKTKIELSLLDNVRVLDGSNNIEILWDNVSEKTKEVKERQLRKTRNAKYYYRKNS